MSEKNRSDAARRVSMPDHGCVAGSVEGSERNLQEGEDFVFENGLMVLTRAYLERRGTCCRSGCRHCPYGFVADSGCDS